MDRAKEIEREKEKEEEEAAVVAEFIVKEVPDWKDEVKSRARFKALSGQRSDWEPLYLFWRDLIVKVARHLRIFIIHPSRVTRLWFRLPESGLTPLCIHRVLVEMHHSGDLLLLPPNYQSHPTTHIFRRALNFLTNKYSRGAVDYDYALTGDYYILAPLLEEEALLVVDSLAQNHWTASCVITMTKFEDICRGSKEALAILNYLSERGRASHLRINKTEPIQGVKVCLAPGAIPTASTTDYSVLHLTWTAEKLEQKLDLIDQRYQKTRNSALTSLKSGNKRVALRYAKELKLISLSRERCTTLLDRVETVLSVIADAESSKKVSEAIKNSTNAIKENLISIEEVELCMQEVDENIDSLKRLDDVLESTPAHTEIDDEDIEAEFDKLRLEVKNERNQGLRSDFDSSETEFSETTDALNKALSNLNLKGGASMKNSVAEECYVKPIGDSSMSIEGSLEAA
ncbi:hypothetical protein ACJIZ3_001826 [Penstemon smallii]|uniref:Charged multivesicular body protein 7 n=1 Tax=Penstemon smallii TaxID=265156 RepID=A0ABD3U7E8_9LAMI